MYFQLFIQTQTKESQYSCDDLNELNETVDQKQPSKFRVEAYDCQGLKVVRNYIWDGNGRPECYLESFRRK